MNIIHYMLKSLSLFVNDSKSGGRYSVANIVLSTRVHYKITNICSWNSVRRNFYILDELAWGLYVSLKVYKKIRQLHHSTRNLIAS